ncbi:hypothetical protein DFH07DRAFT_777948 [Mycena maculata]|uniref:Secreted protein n=1 Tax=Mycena maculata TaxID=230809 RepID=A0AAD7IG20_9AGAR|nr:hypothetical protein DFH07DRAFT_777948 [Mycena maculata]
MPASPLALWVLHQLLAAMHWARALGASAVSTEVATLRPTALPYSHPTPPLLVDLMLSHGMHLIPLGWDLVFGSEYEEFNANICGASETNTRGSSRAYKLDTHPLGTHDKAPQISITAPDRSVLASHDCLPCDDGK